MTKGQQILKDRGYTFVHEVSRNSDEAWTEMWRNGDRYIYLATVPAGEHGKLTHSFNDPTQRMKAIKEEDL